MYFIFKIIFQTLKAINEHVITLVLLALMILTAGPLLTISVRLLTKAIKVSSEVMVAKQFKLVLTGTCGRVILHS